jgi:hypothetical protein
MNLSLYLRQNQSIVGFELFLLVVTFLRNDDERRGVGFTEYETKNRNMKSKYIYFLLLLFASIINANGQMNISEKFKKESILKIDSLVKENYVFADKGKLISIHLKKQYQKGKFKKYNLIDSFANALTKEIRFVNNDKHLGIWPAFIPDQKVSLNNEYESYFHNFTNVRKLANGFKEVKIIDGNVGYLKIDFFPNETNKTIDSYMALLQNTDAVIIDLRNNGGGNPRTVQYLCSYFIKDSVLINTLYYRKDNRTDVSFTTNVNGKKLLDVPLLILTSPKTFSGAEEFSYNMQTQKRGIILGEATGGAANPGEVFKINNHLEMFIPTGTGINPITKKNWEGIGVIPEVMTEANLAYTTAIDLALKLAEEYRLKKQTESKMLYQQLQEIVDQNNILADENDRLNVDTKIFEVVQKMVYSDLYSENDINLFASKITKNPVLTESILKANTQLFPNSPIAFLNYGDFVELSGKKDAALKILKRAVDIATAINAPYLEGLTKRYEQSQKTEKQ